MIKIILITVMLATSVIEGQDRRCHTDTECENCVRDIADSCQESLDWDWQTQDVIDEKAVKCETIGEMFCSGEIDEEDLQLRLDAVFSTGRVLTHPL